MPKCQFLFSAIFLFQKSCSANILGIARNKDGSPYFSNTYTESEGETRGAPRWPHPPGAGGPLAAPPGVWAPRAAPDAAPSPIYSYFRENPRHPSHISRKPSPPPPSSTLTRGVLKLFPAPCRRGESSPAGLEPVYSITYMYEVHNRD